MHWNIGIILQYLIRRQEKHDLVHTLQFWLDVDDFVQQNDKQDDRLYRLCNAWNIFNKYISNGLYRY